MTDEEQLDLSRCPKCGAQLRDQHGFAGYLCDGCNTHFNTPWEVTLAHAEAQFARAEAEKARADRAEAALREIEEYARLQWESPMPAGAGPCETAHHEGRRYGAEPCLRIARCALEGEEPTP